MAGKAIMRPSYKFLLNCHKSMYSVNAIFSLRNYGKKEYNFNLDNLIEWNKDTALAFGSPVKFTKTGKIRKSRKKVSDEQLMHTLEAMNALSASVPVIENVSKKTPMKLPLKQNWQMEKTACSEDIPDYCFDDKVPDSCSEESFSSNQARKKYSKEMTEDGIFIPEIKPMPQHTSNNKVKRQNGESQLLHESPFNIYKNEKMSNSAISLNMSSYNTETKPEGTKEDLVPKPSPKTRKNKLETDNNQLTKSKRKASASEDLSSQFNLPVEPPESYNVITDFPMGFDDQNTVTQFISSKTQAFKTDVEKLRLRTLPPVKSILNKTMPELSRFFLNRWREGMVKELGEEGFKIHQEATIKRGINLHANIMELLSGKPESEIQIMPDNEGHWASLQSAISLIDNVQALEADVRHPFLLYRGVFDCIATYKDLLCVVDWKSSKKPRPLLKNTYDDPLQIAAYVGAMNATNAYNENAQKINHGLIVVIYPDGSPAHIHLMNRTQCDHYWRDWTERLFNYYQLIYTAKFG